MSFLAIALALGLAAFLQRLLEPKSASEDGQSAARRALCYALLSVFALVSLGWPAAQWSSGLRFAPEIAWPEILARTCVGLVSGALAFFCARGRLRFAALGILAGLIFSLVGYYACRWAAIAVALKLIGSFSGAFLWGALPWVHALSLALAGLALLHSDFALGVNALPKDAEDGLPNTAAPGAPGLVLGLALAWSAPAHLAEWRLKTAWGYGPRTLTEAAGISAAERAETVQVAWLRPEAEGPYRFEERRVAAEELNLSIENLEKLYLYLKGHGYRSVFARQALEALRRGWLLWWDAERALEAHMLFSPGAAVPDYRGALGLIGAGPLTLERYRKLDALAELARPRREGFEEVNQAQRIFEGFSSAYARFGDAERARSWLYKIDNLWPIYEKKIEVSPLESFHTGRIGGSLRLDRAPATVIVGLFFLSSSSSSVKSEGSGTLSASDSPDAAGRFEFSRLGAGRYYLGLMGRPGQFSGGIRNSPGIVEITEQAPEADLAPILIEGR